MWVGTGIGMLLPLAAKYLVDVVIPMQHWLYFWIIVVVYIVVSMLMQLVTLFQGYLSLVLRTKVHAAISTEFYDHLLNLPYRTIKKRSAGSQIFRTTDDITMVVTVLNTFFTSLTANMLSLVIAISVMFRLNAAVTLIFIIVVPLAFIFRMYASLLVRPVELKRREHREAITSHLGESYTAIKEIKVNGMESHEVGKYRDLIQQHIGSEYRLWKVNLLLGKIQAFLESGVASVLQWWIWFLVMKQFSTVGTAMAVSWYFGRIMTPFMGIAGSIQKIISAMAPGERVLEVFSYVREDNHVHTFKKLDGPVTEITLSKVSFAYDSTTEVLSNVSFDMSPGRLYFLFGPSGSGKTTLIHLLCKLYTGYQGDILLNGKQLNMISTQSLRHEVRLLEQDPWIFNATVRDNIAYGTPGISQTAIERAARHAGIHDRISLLPEKYDTVIQAGRTDLSGGERQRLALARVLASSASILLLDEPFANLDSDIERDIVHTLRKSYADKIILIITHRHENIKETDKVFRLSD